jgi:hypothetical protein
MSPIFELPSTLLHDATNITKFMWEDYGSRVCLVPYKENSSSQHHPHGEFDADKEYTVRNILAETKTHFLIDWEDDPVTEEHYAQTWEPHANVTADTIADWENQKAEKKRMSLSHAPLDLSCFPHDSRVLAIQMLCQHANNPRT